jgi:hypothetical protein
MRRWAWVIAVLSWSADTLAGEPHREAGGDLTGPVLTGVGVGTMMVGGAVAGAGASIERCPSDGICWPARWALFGGGLGFAALAGSVFLGVGLRETKKSLPPPTEGRADVVAWGAGLGLMIAGGTLGGVGFITSMLMFCTDTCQVGIFHPLPEVALPVGIALIATGAPFVSLGGWEAEEPEGAGVDLEVTGSGLSLRW